MPSWFDFAMFGHIEKWGGSHKVGGKKRDKKKAKAARAARKRNR